MPTRKASGHHSPAALAARRANLQKARAAPRERIYRRSERRRAASLRNLAKAQAALRGHATRARLNALKHGLFARDFSPLSFRLLREDPAEYRAMLRLFRRVFLPQERPERELVTRLAQVFWRRLRLHRARAAREQEALCTTLETVTGSRPPLSADQTEDRAFLVVSALTTAPDLDKEELKFHSQWESLLRALVRKRSGNLAEFSYFSRPRDSRLVEVESLSLKGRRLEELSGEELKERLRYLPPHRLAAMERRNK